MEIIKMFKPSERDKLTKINILTVIVISYIVLMWLYSFISMF